MANAIGAPDGMRYQLRDRCAASPPNGLRKDELSPRMHG